MITVKELEMLKIQKIGDVNTDKLVDIASMTFDAAETEAQKTLSFIERVKNPYLFKVGSTPVRVRFRHDAPSLQSCIEKLMLQND